MDIAAFKQQHSIEDVVRRFVDLKEDGREYRAHCPFHEDSDPSFSVVPDKGIYYCFGCGEKGDVLDFVQKHQSVDLTRAAEIIGGSEAAGSGVTPRQASRRKPAAPDPYASLELEWPISDDVGLPVAGEPLTVWNPKRQKNSKLRPSHIWPYRDEEGRLLGLVIRFQIGKNKLTPLLRWGTYDDDEPGWIMAPFPEPRPLYGLHQLFQRHDAPVLLVEGEKCAEAARGLMTEYVPVTHQGGSKAISKADWSPLAGRHVVLWPDADEAGVQWGAALSEALVPIVGSLKLIQPDLSKPKGWDVADAAEEGLSGREVIAWAKPRVIEPGAVEEPSEAKQEPEEPASMREGPPPEEEPPANKYTGDDTSPPVDADPSLWNAGTPFRILGQNRGTYYYLPQVGSQVVELTASQHTKLHLAQLATLSWWSGVFGPRLGMEAKKPNYDAMGSTLIAEARRKEIFDGVQYLRGRGIWIEDDGRVVFHSGTELYVDGEPTKPFDFTDTRYVYEMSQPLSVPLEDKASVQQSRKLLELCKALPWDYGLSGYLLAGWCVVAPVCGILKWRPHIWLTGEAGSGKTTVLEQLVKPAIGGMVLDPSGNSTEAGIRQQLGQDARPIVYDEAEPEGKRGQERMRSILEMARACSSGGIVTKGSTSGKPVRYALRSAFCFSSINTSDTETADEQRISKLVLRRMDDEGAEERFRSWQTGVEASITTNFSAAMLARTIANTRVLLSNIDTFVKAGAIFFSSRREADQYAALLAGAYLCNSNKDIDVDTALKWMNDQDWSEHRQQGMLDHDKLLATIGSYRHRFQAAKGGPKEATLGEMIQAVFLLTTTQIGIDEVECQRQLGIVGIRLHLGATLDEGRVYVINSSPAISRILRETPWRKWHFVLRQIKGAEPLSPRHYSPTLSGRGTSIPFRAFLPDGEAPETTVPEEDDPFANG